MELLILISLINIPVSILAVILIVYSFRKNIRLEDENIGLKADLEFLNHTIKTGENLY